MKHERNWNSRCFTKASPRENNVSMLGHPQAQVSPIINARLFFSYEYYYYYLIIQIMFSLLWGGTFLYINSVHSQYFTWFFSIILLSWSILSLILVFIVKYVNEAAYKQQKWISHSAGGYGIQDQVTDRSGRSSFLVQSWCPLPCLLRVNGQWDSLRHLSSRCC